MNWKKLKDKIYFWDGSWRDIYIPNTTEKDWNKWINFVNENYQVDWYNGKAEADQNKIDFNVILEYWNGNHDLCSTAKIFIDKIQINAHFFDDQEIENDIDPREFKSITDHNRLMQFMKGISRILNKKVFLTPENEHETILITADGENIVYGENIDPSKWTLSVRE